MAEFNKGQFFFDKKAINYQGQKGKYFIALSNADYDDDWIICFVLNTENRMNKYNVGCNKKEQKYILVPNSFIFITNYTAIMLSQPCRYFLKEIYLDAIHLLDCADDLLCRHIKNCIDWNFIPIKMTKIIKDCFR